MTAPRALSDLTGRVACVTGASSGLGRRAARVPAAAGAQVVGVARRVAEPFGAPDMVVHAAGLNTRQCADDVTPEGWDRTQALGPAMKARGWGRILTFASLQTTRAMAAASMARPTSPD